mmetsp:Transcript_52766/g.157973  ORF Transcript_52766/g.157973 Transcript_52766/m.157973 type:complete len:97 (-) Transcript_52766:217-507(-)
MSRGTSGDGNDDDETLEVFPPTRSRGAEAADLEVEEEFVANRLSRRKFACLGSSSVVSESPPSPSFFRSVPLHGSVKLKYGRPTPSIDSKKDVGRK